MHLSAATFTSCVIMLPLASRAIACEAGSVSPACAHAAYLWVVGTGLLGYLMLEQFIQRGDSWCVCLHAVATSLAEVTPCDVG